MNRFHVIFISMMASSSLLCNACQEQNSSEEFVDFLAKQHYLDGTKDITNNEHKEYVKNIIKSFDKGESNLFSDDFYMNSFASCIAFVAAQVQLFDTATKVLEKLHKDGESNWLFDMIESEGKAINEKSIMETLKALYPSD